MGLTRIRAEQISDIDYKQAVRVITRTDVTLSGGAPATVDGVSLVTGDRILVNGQSNAAQNGLYQVQTVGAGSNGTWVRTLDANADGEIEPGMVVMVTEGLTYADTPWKLTTNGEIIIGTTELTFTENYSLAFGNIFANGTAVIANTVSSPITFAAGDNISITGNNTTKTVTISATSGTSSSIANGTSNVNIATSNGNVTTVVNGNTILTVASTSVGAQISANLLVSGRQLPVGGSYVAFPDANRGLVAINGSFSSLLEMNIGNTNRGYVYHDGTGMSLWNSQNGSLVLATAGAARMTLYNTGVVEIPGVLSVLNAIDLSDNDILRFGNGDDWEMYHNGTQNNIDLNVGDLVIRDDGTAGDPERFRFGRTTGDFTTNGTITSSSLVPITDNTGSVGTALRTWATGQFTSLTIDSTLTASTINVSTAVDLADDDILRFGTSDDWELYHTAGGDNRMDLNTGNLVIRDDGTAGDPTRFTFGRTTGDFIATGNVTGANVISNALVSASTVEATGNITGNNVSTTTSFGLPVYADDTARDAAITSPQPGMMVFVTGTGLQVRGATAWNTVSGTAT